MTTEDERDREWQCSVCGEWKVIKPLARDCESKHAQERTTTRGS